jgi:hypothetical protein
MTKSSIIRPNSSLKLNSERNNPNPMPSINRDYSLNKQKSIRITADNISYQPSPKIGYDMNNKKALSSARNSIYNRRFDDVKIKNSNLASQRFYEAGTPNEKQRYGASAYEGSFKAGATLKQKNSSSNNLVSTFDKSLTKSTVMNSYNKRENRYDFSNL